MYKDKDKQREAVKQATRRYRAKNKVSVLSGYKGATGNARGCDIEAELSDTQPVIPSNVIPFREPVVIPKPEPQSHNPMMVGYVPPTD